MKIRALKREIPKRAALAVVALVAVASVVMGREKPTLEVIEPKIARTEPAAFSDIDLDKLTRSEAAAPQNDPFARRSFAPRQQASSANAPPAAPTVPPLPFTYFGKLIQNGKTEVFVMRGDEVISIAAGQKIDAEYRVDAITESSIAFTYLPLKTKQSLELSEAGG
jgi:hypothetical protein